MSLSFNITNPGLNFDGILTSVESQYVTDLVLAGGTASENEVLTWKSGAPSWEAPTGGAGYTNLTQFVAQTAWRIFYSNTDGDVTELALGADGTFLKSNGATSAPTFATPAGSGDVVGPASATADGIAIFNGLTGKVIKDSGVTTASFAPALGADDNYVTDAEKAALPNTVIGPASATDNAIVRYDGTTGKLVQNSTVTVGDTGAIATTIAAAGNAVGITVTQNDTTNNPRAVSITNTGTATSLFIDPNGIASASTSVGGAILLENTGNTGAGLVIYSNAGASTGRLMNIRADNVLFDQPCLHIDNDGTTNALEILHNSTDASANAISVVSVNENDSTVGITGRESGKGTIKVTHNKPDGVADTNASAISVNLSRINGTETSQAQGIFIDSDHTTTGKLLKIRNNTVEQLTLSATGILTLAGTAPAIELGHATDTTISRVSAGVIAVENIPVVTAGSSTVGYVPTITGANTYTWQAAVGGGNVSKVGTPADNQIGVWTGDGTIEGDTALTFDSSSGSGILYLGGDGGVIIGAGGLYLQSSDNGPIYSTETVLEVGDGSQTATVKSSGNYDLILQTGNATTGTITITDGANGNISLTPNGTGTVAVSTTLDIGHASDTTLSRVSAGVVAVEGVTVPTISSTNTLTNKRTQPRTSSTTTASTLTPDVSSYNVYFRTTQTEALTIGAPTGTPVIGETIMIYVDSAGAQTLTMNATYKVFGAAFPATTTAGKTLMLSCQYNGTDWKTLWANAI